LAGTHLLGIDLHPVHDREQYFRIIADYAAAHSELPVLSGGGWFGDVFDGGLPTATELDAIVSDRPVILFSHDAHGVWTNTRALQLAGIDTSTPDPVDGRIVRDADGRPTGMLLEGAASPAAALIPDPDSAFLERAMLAAQQRLHSVGITAWQDAAVGMSDIGPDPLPVYESLDRRGLLTARVVTALWWDRNRGLEQIQQFEAVRERLRSSARLDGGTVKVMLDGMVENRTASMLSPFVGHPDDRGLAFFSDEDATALTVALDAAGFQIHFHAVGDAAVRTALDALAAARVANGPSSNRHHIAHLDVVDPADFDRFSEVDATANVSALWARLDEEIVTRKLPLLGPEREQHHFPFGSISRAGARIVGGSDWPVTDPNPLWAVKTAVTRKGVPEDPHAVGDEVLTTPLLAHESVGLGIALDAYTSEAAYVNRLDECGSLRVGAFADLVWIDRDLRDIDGLGSARVLLTVVAGEPVYSADEDQPAR
ncbi:MAG: amidohydrolase, partial [Mycetocola sp.]